MEFKLPNNVILTTAKQRSQEFINALNYLTTNHPVPTTRIEVTFYKKDGVNFKANADYNSAKWEGFFNPVIRVAYGSSGNDPDAVKYLFHEYRHLIQDYEGRLTGYGDQPELCVEADAWAIEQEKLFKAQQEAL